MHWSGVFIISNNNNSKITFVNYGDERDDDGCFSLNAKRIVRRQVILVKKKYASSVIPEMKNKERVWINYVDEKIAPNNEQHQS